MYIELYISAKNVDVLIKTRFWTLSIVTGYKNTTFRELALLLSSGKRGGFLLSWVP
jgi:hypothetical protein